MAREHYEEYRRSCRENDIPVNEAAVPDSAKGTGSSQVGQQPITNCMQVEQKATARDRDTAIELILDFIIETNQVNNALTDDATQYLNSL